MKKTIIVFILSIAALSSYSQQFWSTPVGIREIAVPTLGDIAVASFDADGPVIYFNPYVVQQAGPLVTAFFQAHEYGHHELSHVKAHMIQGNNPHLQLWLLLNSENEADAYSVRYHVKNGNKNVLQATYYRFIYFPNNGDASHPPSIVRANNIATLYFQLTGTPLIP